jgi:hypothetical protein
MDVTAKAAGVAWWSSAPTPTREGVHSIPNPGNPFPTLRIGASPLFWDVAGRFCSICKKRKGLICSKKLDNLQKKGGGTAGIQCTKNIFKKYVTAPHLAGMNKTFLWCLANFDTVCTAKQANIGRRRAEIF